MQLKREIKFETLRKSHKKQIIIGSVFVCVIGSILTFNLTKAKYRLTQSMKLVTGTINYKVPDLRIVALYTENDSNEYVESDDVPASGYTLNEEKSLCKVYDGTTSVAEAPIDTKATITYQDGLVTFANISKKNTRCYLYFDKIIVPPEPANDTLAKLNVTSSMIHTDEPDFTTTATEAEFTSSYSKVTNLTNITNDTAYPFDYDESTGIFISKNKTDSSTSILTFSPNEEVNAICYIISSEEKYDKAIIYLDGTKKEEVSGEKNSCIELGSVNSSNTIKVEYTKDSSQSKGKDQVEFYIAKTNGYIPIENNGIYKTADPMYGENTKTYYWRGAATTNYVIFADKCWRIIRINGDGTIRLIYNGATNGGTTCNNNPSDSIAVASQKYNASANNASYVGYTYTKSKQRPEETPEESNLKIQTDIWYNNNIGNNDAYKDKVADGKFCNDRNTKNNEAWKATGSGAQDYAAKARLVESKTPTLSCNSQDVYTLKAGAITADEISMAGGKYEVNNTSYYLYNASYYWTITPSDWSANYSYMYGHVFVLGKDGGLRNPATSYGDVSSEYGIRPVINLRSDVTFNSGSDGTQNNPYIVQ